MSQWSDAFSPPAEAGTTVKYYLIAIDTAGNTSDPSPQLFVRPGPRSNPAPPASLSAVASDETVTLTWPKVITSSGEIWGYRVERRDSAGGPFNTVSEVLAEPGFVDAHLTNGHTYWYQVRTWDTARRVSDAQGPAEVTPADTLPPGPPTSVEARAEREANLIEVRWARGLEPDIDRYRVYRSTSSDPNDLGEDRSGTSGVPNSDGLTLSFIDSAPHDITYFYRVRAFDEVSNASAPSAAAAARARRSDMTPPVLGAAQIEVYDNGTSSADGVPGGGQVDGGNTIAEDDDIIKVELSWSPGTGVTKDYVVYRKAADDAEFARVASPTGTSYTDTQIVKGQYSYFVVGRKANDDESAGSPVVTVSRPLSPVIPVRNLCMADSRKEYLTANRESRLVYVSWSRVAEPDLRGYNVYRMCKFDLCREAADMDMQTFACEPAWTRINASLIPPETRLFADSSVGGLQGCFIYGVRPVGPKLVEGPLTKVVESSLHTGQPTGDQDHVDCTMPDSHYRDELDAPAEPMDTYLGALSALSRSGPMDGAPAPVQDVVRTVLQKMTRNSTVVHQTKLARVTWTMPEPVPQDLKGFHVEVAGSPYGPWTRVTTNPVAWWERHYTMQGTDVDPPGAPGFTPHRTDCLHVRVLAVDESGNESSPTLATNVPTSAASCPITPQAPANLRATSLGFGTGTGLDDAVRLDWDPVYGAAAYYVYRLLVSGGNRYFYVVRTVTDGSTTFTENWGIPPDPTCPYSYCPPKSLEAYYVTARGAVGGESPRSNVVLWKWGPDPGYARLAPSELESFDAIASRAADAPEAQACWSSKSLSASEDGPAFGLTAVPMRTLGTLADPPWTLLNLHTDHLGTVRLVTHQVGTLVSRHDYFPFGETMPAGMSSVNTHQFTGHERDAESGLDYMLARYYGDDLPRFMSPDPISFGDEFDPQSWNLYTYVGNNPLAYVDPTGEEMVYAVEMELFLQSSAQIRSQHGVTDPGHLDGFWLHDPASDVQAGLNASTNSWDVIFQSWIKIASHHQTPLSDLIKHEFGHQQDFEASVRQAGYKDLDKQLDRTWQRVQRQGQRKGWSADETNRRALDAVKKKMEKAYKKIAKIYKKKQQKRDRPKPNSYGIDPDGPFGPAPHPCVGQPVC